jgi:hypothetical protein
MNVATVAAPSRASRLVLDVFDGKIIAELLKSPSHAANWL